jgi:predicted translin family RNA/ssDNA-binding protein
LKDGEGQVMDEVDSKRERLVRLIRRIAREEAWEIVEEAVDEHLDDYEHKEKPTEDLEFGGLNCGKKKEDC